MSGILGKVVGRVWLRRTLRFRITTVGTAVTLIVLLSLALVTSRLIGPLLVTSADAQLRPILNSALAHVRDGTQPTGAPIGMQVRVLDTAGTPVDGAPSPPLSAGEIRLLKAGTPVLRLSEDPPRRWVGTITTAPDGSQRLVIVGTVLSGYFAAQDRALNWLVVAALIGAAVVAGGTIIAVETAGDDPPAAAQEAFSVSTRTEQASYEVNIEVTAEIVQVSGHAAAGRINEALREPVDRKIAELRENVAGLRELLEGEERANDLVKAPVSAEIRLHNSRYLSVRYHMEPESDLISNSSWQSYGTVTVDLQTGEPVDPTTMYEPVVLTEGGLSDLAQLLIDNSPDALCADPTAAGELELAPENLGREVVVAFTRDAAEFTIALPLLGHANACGMPTVAVPYAELADVLDPALITGLTSG